MALLVQVTGAGFLPLHGDAPATQLAENGPGGRGHCRSISVETVIVLAADCSLHLRASARMLGMRKLSDT